MRLPGEGQVKVRFKEQGAEVYASCAAKFCGDREDRADRDT